MVRAQHHRGPDDCGVYVNDQRTCGLGHNRLTIIDLSDAGHQPMVDASGTRRLVFNGEIYNYLELRAQLTGYPFQGNSDSEVILAAYERWGESCVDRFIGMFAFAIWDSRSQKLFAARDRVGIKPFHFAQLNGEFLFASEIKGLLAAGIPCRPNLETWACYLTHGIYDHSAETFFDSVECLPPGHILNYSNGQLRVRPYWNLPDAVAERPEIDLNRASEQFVTLLDDAVRLRLRSDVPLGVNLSGGLDSSSLMATVDRLTNEGEIKAFTACYQDPQYDELSFADAVPRRTRWQSVVSRLDPLTAWDGLQKMQWHLEAPFGGLGTMAYYHLHQTAADEGVTVLLEAQGVDELLGGYQYYQGPRLRDLWEARRFRALRTELRGGVGSVAELRNALAGDSKPVYQDGTSFLNEDSISADVRRLAGVRPTFAAPFANHLSNALYRDFRHTKLPRVLRMNDRLSMAHSRELRETFLDHRLVEFAFALPSELKIQSGRTKVILRDAMQDRLPREIRETPKRPVVTPQREWLRTILKAQVEELLFSASFAERGLFDVQAVKSEWRRFCDGGSENSFFVWQWINTELWFRTFAPAVVASKLESTARATPREK